MLEGILVFLCIGFVVISVFLKNVCDELESKNKSLQNQVDYLQNDVLLLETIISEKSIEIKNKDGIIVVSKEQIKNKDITIKELEKRINQLKEEKEQSFKKDVTQQIIEEVKEKTKKTSKAKTTKKPKVEKEQIEKKK